MIATAGPGDIAVRFETIAPEGAIETLAATQTGARLQYAFPPPPTYPREALRKGLRGTVVLQVLVDVDGKPLRVDVAQSSGHRSLGYGRGMRPRCD